MDVLFQGEPSGRTRIGGQLALHAAESLVEVRHHRGRLLQERVAEGVVEVDDVGRADADAAVLCPRGELQDLAELDERTIGLLAADDIALELLHVVAAEHAHADRGASQHCPAPLAPLWANRTKQ